MSMNIETNYESIFKNSLQWRHNRHDSVSNHQPHDCLLSRLFRLRSKKTSKLCVSGLCEANSPIPVNSPHKGPVTPKGFHLMTSSCSSAKCRSFCSGLHCVNMSRLVNLMLNCWYFNQSKWNGNFTCMTFINTWDLCLICFYNVLCLPWSTL